MLKALAEIDLLRSKEEVFREIDKNALNQSIGNLLKSNIK